MTDHHPVGVALENRLMSHGIYVTDVRRIPPEAADAETEAEAGSASDATADTEPSETDAEPETPPDGTGIALEYERVSEASGVDSQEVGAVVRTLLDIANERGWAPGRLEATSVTTEGERRGRWHVERAWFEGLGTELDDIEFSRRVLATRRADDGDE